MGIVSFKKGSIVFQGKDRYEVIGTFDLKSVLAKDPESGEQKVLPVGSLRSTPATDEAPASKGISTFTHVNDRHWAQALSHYEAIKPLLTSNRSVHDIEARAEQFKVSATTIYRWIRRFETTGTISSLVPKFDDRGGKGKSRIGKVQEAIVTEVIDKFFLTGQRLRPKEVHKEITKACRSANVDPPHKNTLINRIRKIRKKTRASAREGSKVAEDQYGEKIGHFPDGKFPLDVIQIDHMRVNAVVVDEAFRQEMDRPWLTVAIDVFSRVIYGIYLSPDDPGYFSVSQCLTHAFLPKDKFLRSIGAEGEWDVYGKPRVIHADNAWAFRGVDLVRVCAEEYDITLEWRPVKHPEYGAHIERLCSTLKRRFETLPGTTFANAKERGEYDSEGKAVMTISELEKWLTDYIINTYHRERHSGIGMPPMKKYELGIRGDGTMPGTGLPSAIDDEERLRISMYPFMKRAVNRDGIVIEHVQYYHDVLRKWINAKEGKRGKLFQINYNPRDMSIVYFYDPELKLYFPIPYLNTSRKPVTLWDMRKANKYLREQGVKDIDEDALFMAHERRSKMVDEAKKKTKTVRKEMEKREFHKRKHAQEKASVANEGEGEAQRSDRGERAKKDTLKALFTDVKPFQGVKIVQKKAGGSNDSDVSNDG